MNEVFTIEEVAEFLRTDATTVGQLLESGELAGFRVNKEWRIVAQAVIRFLEEQVQSEQSRILMRELNDARSWAHELRKDPQFESEIRASQFSEGSMGAFLQRGLNELDAPSKANNVIDIRSPKKTNCQCHSLEFSAHASNTWRRGNRTVIR